MKNLIRHTPNRARKVEKKYGRQLRQIASHVDSIIKGFDVTDETIEAGKQEALEFERMREEQARQGWGQIAGGAGLMRALGA